LNTHLASSKVTASQIVDRIQPIAFTYKTDSPSAPKNFGLLADTVDSFGPGFNEIADKTSKGELKGINTTKLLFLTLQALKEANQRITALEQQQKISK